jgi:hypothetical protein
VVLIRKDGENCTVKSFIICTLCPNIIRGIKLRRVRWAGLVPCVRKVTNSYKTLVGKPEGKRSQNTGIEVRII